MLKTKYYRDLHALCLRCKRLVLLVPRRRVLVRVAGRDVTACCKSRPVKFRKKLSLNNDTFLVEWILFLLHRHTI